MRIHQSKSPLDADAVSPLIPINTVYASESGSWSDIYAHRKYPESRESVTEGRSADLAAPCSNPLGTCIGVRALWTQEDVVRSRGLRQQRATIGAEGGCHE